MAGRYYKVQTLNVVVEVKLSAAEEQEKWLADALNVVKQQAFYMRRALPPPLPAFADSQDSGNLREALKYSAQMLSELRTSKLAPQKYYELCTRLKVHRIRTVPQPCVHGMADIVVCGELQNLEAFFWDEHKMRGRSCVDLYELVQHAGNIVPRLYLLCTVGAVYIRSKEGPAKEVLSDLSEVCKGVQHPIRGLFLRAHLTQCSRDKLPDTGSEYEGEGGTVVDAVEFLLQNFTEMNKLWVRMQHQGPATEREKREQERRELRDLVGKNLHLLSQLEGVNLDMYKTVVLPPHPRADREQQGRDSQQYLMDCLIQVFPDDFHLNTLETLLGACPECVHCIHPPSPPLSFPSSLVPFLIGPPFQIVNCRDEIAQQYLMDCLIQVFPDDFHLNTLETLLGACPELQPSVDVRTIMSQLMDRLSTFMDKNPDVSGTGSLAIPALMCEPSCLNSWTRLSTFMDKNPDVSAGSPAIPQRMSAQCSVKALPHFLEVDAFAKFNSAVSKVMEAQAERLLKGVVSLHLLLHAMHVFSLTPFTAHPHIPPPRQVMEAQAEMPLKGVVSLHLSLLHAMRLFSLAPFTTRAPILFLPHQVIEEQTEMLLKGVVMEAQAEMPLKSVVSLHLALLQFVLRVHPDRLDYIDQVLAACVGILDARRQTKDSPTTKQLVALLSAALDKFGPGGVLTVLQLPHYARVMGHLDHETNKAMAVVIIQNMVKHETTIGDPEKVSYGLICFSPAALRAGLCLCSTNSRLQRDYARVMGHLDHGTNKAMAVVIIQNMVKHETTIGDPEKVECLLSLVRHLTQDMDGVPPVDELDMDDFSEEQNLVARLVHLLVNPDPRIQFQILAIIRTHLFKGGQSRLRFTIPSLVFCSLQLVHQLLSQGITGADQALATAGAAASQAAMAAAAAGEGPVTPLTLFLFLHKVVETLSEFVPPLALKLALECAQVASACGLEPIAYDLFTLAFVIYEEEISDSKAQVTALHLIIGTLQRCHVFAEENRDTLTHKATGYSAKLLKKADQCRAVCTCAHLFWSDEENGPRDGERVVLCLKRALKIANAAAQQLSSAARVLSRFTAFTPIYHSHPRIPILLISYPLLPMHQGGAVSQESAQDCQRSSSAALSRCQSARFARGAAGGDSQQGNPHVTPVVLQGLIELITSELAVDGATVDATVHSFYRATLAHIKDQKHKAGAIGEKYAEIQI
ncbi:unnamed protein product [Closterium sp. NIES-65]|nr:unnamed protein product [Closterium sp. NIES-65]